MRVFSAKSFEIDNDSLGYLIWVDHINLNCVLNGCKLKLNKNSLLIIRPFESFSGLSNYNSKFKVIRLNVAVRKRVSFQPYDLLLERLEKTYIIEAEEQIALKIERSFYKALNCSCLQNGLNNDLLLSDVTELICKGGSCLSSKTFQFVFEFYRLVSDNYKLEHLVNVYAKKLRMQPKLLLKDFQEIGFNCPSVIIKEKILLEARRLLLFSNNSIRDICFDLGFDDPSYFARVFKKNVGFTASNYRMIYNDSANCEKCAI